ncbi:cation-transporting P-type ATPase [Candidatus Micrarchaeota archaeon]|nr:cation-transporting P-type ATPase [Candidatus Micrarchaeota archaeon]
MEMFGNRATRLNNRLKKLDKLDLFSIAKLTADEVCKLAKTDPDKGLSHSETLARLKAYGKNAIQTYSKKWYEVLVEQFVSPLVITLIAAGFITFFFLNDINDSLLIFILVLVNGIIGFFQEYKAERIISKLMKRIAPKVVVMRDGKPIKISSDYLVPGDILLLHTGMKIPADARVIESDRLSVNESVLTGESVPKDKISSAVETQYLGDLHNMVFAGTLVTRGKGKAVVVKTGMDTQLGRIANLVARTERETPLVKTIRHLAKSLTLVTLAITAIVFLVGWAQGRDIVEMFETAVGLGVAAIPEGLPAVVTVALTIGIKRMEECKVLVRRLVSVESLGRTDIICADKTGTLTKNEMTVKEVFMDGKQFEVTGRGYDTEGEIIGIKEAHPSTSKFFARIAKHCNDSGYDPETGQTYGDPTEIALKVLTYKMPWHEVDQPRVATLEFDSKRKLMSTIHRTKKGYVQYTKGAPDILIKKCSRILKHGKVRKMTDEDRREIKEAFDNMSRKALRVIALAYRERKTVEFDESDLVFVGLAGMFDPPREGVKEAIRMAQDAGINVKMLTGDYIETATAIGGLLGISGRALDGPQIDTMSDDELEEVLKDANIFARVSPEHKLRIVNVLEKRHTVAMTGDGINDAPSLKRASVGIAAADATDVAREAADIVMIEDHFKFIVDAIEEGRRIYDNIKKFVVYLLSSNIAEVMIIFLGMMMGWPLPLTMVQLLWINIVTDGPPALALSVDPPAPDIMKRKPLSKNTPFLDRKAWIKMLTVASLIAVTGLALFGIYIDKGILTARSVLFTSVIILEWVRVAAVRKEYGLSMFSNRYLIVALVFGLTLQLMILYVPIANDLFGTTPIGAVDWLYILIAASVVYVVNRFIIDNVVDRLM